ncbi:MAG: cysteine desulfurase NifS [Spirochaetes bacterium]|nr:cysteine desulfurase NifS [Spirochaetota bacterium]
MSGQIIYFDNNATTKVAPEVFEAMKPFLTERYGNPSSMHTFGGSVAKDVETAREKVASLIGAEPYEILFTSCGTESDNFAIWGILDATAGKNHIITSKVEHPAILNTLRVLERSGYEVTYLSVNANGELNIDELKRSIKDTTALITIMHANNETGVIFPVEEIAAIANSYGVIFHTDAVQTTGKIPLAMRTNKIDLLSLSGHKLHAPKGVGALYIRKGTRIRPFITGGHQERGRRGGTENVASIVGLGVAADLAQKDLADEAAIAKLRDALEKKIVASVPNTKVNGGTARRLPNTVNISFKYIEGEAILLMLDETGICASSGSACTSGSLEPSHVLRAMGVPFEYAHGSIRFSLSRYNTITEVDTVAETIVPIVKRLRELSPFNDTTGMM